MIRSFLKSNDIYRQLDEEIRVVVRGQNSVEREGREALESARNVIVQLANRILEIKEQAKQSEQIVIKFLFLLIIKYILILLKIKLKVNEITCDIKQLDNAKRNLTTSMIMLNNLHILVEGTDKLQSVLLL